MKAVASPMAAGQLAEPNCASVHQLVLLALLLPLPCTLWLASLGLSRLMWAGALLV